MMQKILFSPTEPQIYDEVIYQQFMKICSAKSENLMHFLSYMQHNHASRHGQEQNTIFN